LPLIFRTLIDDVLTPRDEALLVQLLVGLLLAGVVYAVVSVARDILHARVSQAILVSVRERLYTHLQRQSVGFHARTPTATLLAHFTTDLTRLKHSLVGGVMWGLTAVFGLILSGSLLFALEWRLALLGRRGAVIIDGRAMASRRASIARQRSPAGGASAIGLAHPRGPGGASDRPWLSACRAVCSRDFGINLLGSIKQLPGLRCWVHWSSGRPNIAYVAFNLTVLRSVRPQLFAARWPSARSCFLYTVCLRLLKLGCRQH
jgi:ABC-type multidrug transport system fused ATPase/permease subunit